MLRLGTIISERYEIIKVGSGGMADVYKAKVSQTKSLRSF